MHERVLEHKLAQGQLQDTIPEFDVIELHVNRLMRVMKFWTSVIFGCQDRNPIPVPDYDGWGYALDVDGGIPIVMRAKPKVTMKPGEGLRVVQCRCKPVAEGRADPKKCTTCVCKGTCSQLCKCTRTCCGGRMGPP